MPEFHIVSPYRMAGDQPQAVAKLVEGIRNGLEEQTLKGVTGSGKTFTMACKDKDHDHIRYEAGDLVYHLLVTLERFGVTLDELAGELNARMK